MDKKAHQASPWATPGASPSPSVTSNPDLLAAAATAPSLCAASLCRGGVNACSPSIRLLAQGDFATVAVVEETFFAGGGGAAGAWAVLGATVEQRIWNSALALVS